MEVTLSSLQTMEDAGFSRTAVGNAKRVLNEVLRPEGVQPRRVDTVDDDAVVFLFMNDDRQGTIDCHADGDIVVGYSDSTTVNTFVVPDFDKSQVKDAVERMWNFVYAGHTRQQEPQ